jgi:hypothetical protein
MNNHSKTDRVILKLLGIEKKWVFHNGNWVDMNSLDTPTNPITVTEFETEGESNKKWWQFWRKS